MFKRIKAACRTNDTQLTAIFLLAALNVSAAHMGDNPDWKVYLVALGMWPAFAFCINLIDPIPEPKDDD